jgi:acetoacetate decarboxylase
MNVAGLPAIASGRAISAYAKKLGAPLRVVDADTLVGTLGRLPREARP